MNTLTLKAAIKRLGDITGKTEAEIKELLAKDEKQFSGEEIEEIYQVIIEPKSSDSKESIKHGNINDGLGLENVNYENFMPIASRNDDDEEVLKPTPDFLKYKEIEKGLIWNQIYEFDCIRARGQFRKKANGDHILIGLQIISFTPKYTTKTEARHIVGLDLNQTGLNAQIHNPDNPPSNSIFYLLKKV